MDLTTIVGIILGIIAIVGGMIFKGASISALINPAAIMIILVGTTASVSIAFPGKNLKKFPTLLKIIFTNKKNQLTYQQILEMFMRWTTESRKNGILSLEKELKEIDDEFLQKGLKLVIDGATEHEIESILENEIEATEERHAKGALLFTQAGTYAPTLGVLGAVIGLVAALGDLSDIEKIGHAIAGAFIATLFGIFTGYVLWHPFANKLKQKSAEEMEMKKIVLQCLLLLKAGAFPILMKNTILSLVSKTEGKLISNNDKPGEKE